MGVAAETRFWWEFILSQGIGAAAAMNMIVDSGLASPGIQCISRETGPSFQRPCRVYVDMEIKWCPPLRRGTLRRCGREHASTRKLRSFLLSSASFRNKPGTYTHTTALCSQAPGSYDQKACPATSCALHLAYGSLNVMFKVEVASSEAGILGHCVISIIGFEVGLDLSVAPWITSTQAHAVLGSS